MGFEYQAAHEKLFKMKMITRCKWVDTEAERKAAATALKAVEARIGVIKDALTFVAEQKGLAKFFGDRGEIAVTVKDKLVPPRKTHEPEKAAELEEALRASAWWQELSSRMLL